jgi:hypothetical protein
MGRNEYFLSNRASACWPMPVQTLDSGFRRNDDAKDVGAHIPFHPEY